MKRRTFVSTLGSGVALSALIPPRRLLADQGGQTMYDARAYLDGNFGPVASEVTATDLPVIGNLPPELSGRYLRNGPNPLGHVDLATHHWFSGEGMVHGVRLAEGRAQWYRNRYVRSQAIVEALGEDPAGRVFAGSANTHVVSLAGRTFAIVEAGSPPVELTYELDTVGANNFFGTLPDMAFTAHPKVDPDTGDVHAMAYSWPGFLDHVQYVHVGRDGRVRKTLDVPVPGMVMMHDMSLTERYVVIYDLPVTVSGELINQGMRFPFAWNAEYEPRVGLLPRDGTAADIVWITVPPCYVFHPMNAYDDEDGSVVVDVCRYEKMFVQDHSGPFRDSLATLTRWRLNPASRRVSETVIDERAQEFPRCHPARSSKPYRYGYAVAVAGGGSEFPAIYKHDLHTGERAVFDLGPGRHSGEPYFVPRQGGTATGGASSEDDGYLISFVYDSARDASELVVLDARDAGRAPLARVMLPARVPYGFHGSWVPDGWDGPSV
ncbi:MAG TPA: carotenoid oxygenase family protein [Pseudomonadales bacterium]